MRGNVSVSVVSIAECFSGVFMSEETSGPFLPWQAHRTKQSTKTQGQTDKTSILPVYLEVGL